MQAFIDELLPRHFGKLVTFVRALDANPAAAENPDKGMSHYDVVVVLRKSCS